MDKETQSRDGAFNLLSSFSLSQHAMRVTEETPVQCGGKQQYHSKTQNHRTAPMRVIRIGIAWGKSCVPSPTSRLKPREVGLPRA